MKRAVLVFLSMLINMAGIRAQEEITRYVRYSHQGQTAYGILEGETVKVLDGDLFASPRPTGKELQLDEVHLLPPCEPSKVLAVGLNYKSHLGERPSGPQILVRRLDRRGRAWGD